MSESILVASIVAGAVAYLLWKARGAADCGCNKCGAKRPTEKSST